MALVLSKPTHIRAARCVASRNRSVKISCLKQGDVASSVRSQLAAVAIATATLLSSYPADAGVVLQQPALKKVFVEEAAPAPVRSSTLPNPAAKRTEVKKVEDKKVENEEPAEFAGSDIDPRSVALPGAIVGVAGLAFAASKLDGGFDAFMTEAMVKDSNNFAGYEPLIKEGNVAVLSRGTQAFGTKKVKTSKKK